jgi:hypothetical protein
MAIFWGWGVRKGGGGCDLVEVTSSLLNQFQINILPTPEQKMKGLVLLFWVVFFIFVIVFFSTEIFHILLNQMDSV